MYKIDVISVGVDHCFGGCFVKRLGFCDAFRKKKNTLSFKKEKKKRVQRLKLEVFFEAKKEPPPLSIVNRRRTKKGQFGPRKRHHRARGTNTTRCCPQHPARLNFSNGVCSTQGLSAKVRARFRDVSFRGHLGME